MPWDFFNLISPLKHINTTPAITLWRPSFHRPDEQLTTTPWRTSTHAAAETPTLSPSSLLNGPCWQGAHTFLHCCSPDKAKDCFISNQWLLIQNDFTNPLSPQADYRYAFFQAPQILNFTSPAPMRGLLAVNETQKQRGQRLSRT